MFFIAAAIYIFGAVFYVIFASGDLQPWAQSEEVGSKSHEVECTSKASGEEQEMLAESNDIV